MKKGAERDLFNLYFERAAAIGAGAGFSKLEMLEVSESRAREKTLRKKEEGAALKAKLPSAKMFAFDEKGENMSSRAFAERLQSMMTDSVACWAGIIGGPDGLDDSWLDEAERVIAFGAGTLPHRLARIVLAEQIYRAGAILTSHPYHREE